MSNGCSSCGKKYEKTMCGRCGVKHHRSATPECHVCRNQREVRILARENEDLRERLSVLEAEAGLVLENGGG